MMKKVEIDFHGRPLSIEVGRLAKQADGAALVTYGETVVLVTAVAAKDLKMETDFFPLTVDYQEKTFAAGKIPSALSVGARRKKRSACRLIDRQSGHCLPKAALRNSGDRHRAFRDK
jgi:polyribonucleotide nucleotidyltransferase